MTWSRVFYEGRSTVGAGKGPETYCNTLGQL